jgi:hypothetical protein
VCDLHHSPLLGDFCTKRREHTHHFCVIPLRRDRNRRSSIRLCQIQIRTEHGERLHNFCVQIGVTPSTIIWFTSAPAPASTRTISVWRFCAAISIEVPLRPRLTDIRTGVYDRLHNFCVPIQRSELNRRPPT